MGEGEGTQDEDEVDGRLYYEEGIRINFGVNKKITSKLLPS